MSIIKIGLKAPYYHMTWISCLILGNSKHTCVKNLPMIPIYPNCYEPGIKQFFWPQAQECTTDGHGFSGGSGSGFHHRCHPGS